MRIACGLVSLLCGAVIIGVAVQYGYSSADTPAKGALVAFFCAIISGTGLYGHSVASRLWSQGDKGLAAAIGVVSVLALTISLSNSLAALVGRSEQTDAKRIQTAKSVKSDEDDLVRAQRDRAAMKFTPTDQAAVNAATAASDAIKSAKEAECVKDGPKCKLLKEKLEAALATVTNATSNKSATDEALRLDSQIASLKLSLRASGPVLGTNTSGNAIVQLFRLPTSKAELVATWQNFTMGALAEIIAVLFMMAYVKLDREHNRKTASETPVRRDEPVVLDPLPETEDEPKAFPVPSRPRLVAAEAKPTGNVASIIADLIESGRGKTEIADLYSAYAEACHEQGKAPVDVDAFGLSIMRICRDIGIKIEAKGDRVYLMKVRLKNRERGLDLLEQSIKGKRSAE
jgi:predicted lipid-binding transport protein (Tim44 family)